MGKMIDWALGKYRALEGRNFAIVFVAGLVLLGCRLFLARPFWNSAQTRWVEFPTQLTSSTNYLFVNEFKLNFFWGSYPIPFAEFAAYMTGLGEIILPILLVLGVLTRFWALGLLAMTVVIQLVFPDGLFNPVNFLDAHALWFVLALIIIQIGPGLFSLDWVLRKIKRAVFDK